MLCFGGIHDCPTNARPPFFDRRVVFDFSPRFALAWVLFLFFLIMYFYLYYHYKKKYMNNKTNLIMNFYKKKKVL
jgi:cbb3-type cytochrome oxidase subunit 3